MEYQPVDLYFEEFGSGTPLVLIHGFPLNHTIWMPVVPLLKEKVRLILPDLRGHGKSPVVEGVSSMRLMAEDIAALLDRLNIEKAVIVGQSMGGYVSLAFAQAYPQRLAGLGLVATQSTTDTPEKRQERLTTADRVRRYGVKSLAKVMASRLTCKPELEQSLYDLILTTPPMGVVAALKGMAERLDMTYYLTSIVAPALVISGTSDPIIPPDRARTMNQLLLRSWLVELPGVGHSPMMEAPQDTADALLQLASMAA